MTGRGRPLRFLALILVGWTGARVALLWPQSGSLEGAIEAVIPFVAAAERDRGNAVPTAISAPRSAVPHALSGLAAPMMPAVWRPTRSPDPARVQMALLNLLQFGDPEYVDAPPVSADTTPGTMGAAAQQWMPPAPDRWSASAWLTVRPGTGLGAAPGGGQLGGSQAGVRIAWQLDRERRVALYGRVAGPLTGKGTEAALGVEWQPSRLPVRVIAEQRIGLDGTRGGPSAGLVGGVDRQLAGFRLEAYGQAGFVARDRVEPYADGGARATRQIVEQGRLRLTLGGGAWGGVQRDARRLDLGPSATVALPLGSASLRVAVDWRQRVAGEARPGSGLALTLGGDF